MVIISGEWDTPTSRIKLGLFNCHMAAGRLQASTLGFRVTQSCIESSPKQEQAVLGLVQGCSRTPSCCSVGEQSTK